MDWYELKETLALVPRHICCEDAGYHLFPPYAGKENIFLARRGIKVNVPSQQRWYLDVEEGNGDPLFTGFGDVNFCPYCGIELEMPEGEALGTGE